MKTFNFTYYGWEPSYGDFDQCDIDITANTEAEAREKLEEMVKNNQLFPKYNFHLVGKYVKLGVHQNKIITTKQPSVANEYLSKRKINSIDEIRLSPLKDVNDMLIADKIQNKKDFELYHKDTHHRSSELSEYFDNWLIRLNVSDNFYSECFQYCH